MDITVKEMLTKAVEQDASDLHLSANNPPIIRVQGRLTRLQGYDILQPQELEGVLLKTLTGMQNEKLCDNKEIDFAYEVEGVGRFRGNIFLEMSTLGAVFRAIPTRPRTMEQLGLPQVLRELALKAWGLILVTGTSGSGKSTTLASMVDYLNDVRNAHIVTIEDPIEYVHKNRRCLIRQREVGYHTNSFSIALKSALRQDPDIILVGEMRDKETIEVALEAAETGHLVLSTLHTNNAPDSVHRIISVFSQDKQEQIRFQLASTLQGIISQLLLPNVQRGKKRVLATELLLVNPAVRNLIREGNIHMIRNVIETGAEYQMHTMDSSLKSLYEEGKISLDTAMSHAVEISNLRRLGMGPGTGSPTGFDPSKSGVTKKKDFNLGSSFTGSGKDLSYK
jgi:twitching motility protein PilT